MFMIDIWENKKSGHMIQSIWEHFGFVYRSDTSYVTIIPGRKQKNIHFS